VEIGKASVLRPGRDLTMVSLGVSVHRCLDAANQLAKRGIDAGVVELRSVVPLDQETVLQEVGRTKRLLVVDEDFKEFGLSGELAARLMEAGVAAKYARVCVEDTLPFDRRREDEALPNVKRIVAAAEQLTGG